MRPIQAFYHGSCLVTTSSRSRYPPFAGRTTPLISALLPPQLRTTPLRRKQAAHTCQECAVGAPLWQNEAVPYGLELNFGEQRRYMLPFFRLRHNHHTQSQRDYFFFLCIGVRDKLLPGRRSTTGGSGREIGS